MSAGGLVGGQAGQAGQGAWGGQAAASGCAVGAGDCAQPARTTIAAIPVRRQRAMWVVYLEMFVALALLILIVWFTLPKKKPRAPEDGRGGDDAAKGGPQ